LIIAANVRFADGWGWEQGQKELLHLNASLAKPEWTRHHYGLIVWKLASYAKMFNDMTNRDRFLSDPTIGWCPEAIVHQLAYRYEREINQAQRSAIKLISEKDDSPSRVMVLCVSQIKTYESVFPSKKDKDIEVQNILELTDGWYTINAVVDEPLDAAISAKRIFIGMKLKVSGCRVSSTIYINFMI
jgi:hypothetical protein